MRLSLREYGLQHYKTDFLGNAAIHEHKLLACPTKRLELYDPEELPRNN